jgi:LPS sulfotransferase NodH
MNLYEKQFLKVNNFSRYAGKPKKNIIICSTPRCGSHMLGYSLFETKRFGFPLEYANPANLAEWKNIFQTNSIDDTFEKLKSIRTSENGVFSIKIHYQHIKQLGGVGEMLRLFGEPYFILLQRKDLLNQAISLSIANQTGVWINGQEATNSELFYDARAIESSLRSIINDNSSWKYLLAKNNFNYLDFDFDEIRGDMASTIKIISEFVQEDISDDCIPLIPPTQKQSTNINKIWRERFVGDMNRDEEYLDDRSFVGSLSKLIFK